MGRSGGTCRLRGPQKSLICWGAFNDAGHQSLRPCHRTRRYGGIGFLLGGECGVSRTNQDFVCLLWGKARYELLFNDRAERYHSCNLVTEREPRQMSEVDKRARRSPVDYWTCGALLRGFWKIAEEQLSCRESFNRRGVCSLGIRIYALVRYKVLAKILCCFICVYKIYCVFLHSFM